MTSDQRRQQGVLLVALGVFVAIGLPDGVLGTVWPTLRDDLGQRQSGLGYLIAAFSIGYTVATLAAGRVIERIGTGLMLRTALTTSTVGLLLVSAAPGWWAVIVGFAVLGVGNGSIDAGLNVWVALTRGPRAMGLLHAAYGVGATAGPLLATAFIASEQGSWRGPFAVILALVAMATVGVASVRRSLDDASTRPDAAGATTDDVPSTSIVTLMMVWFAVYAAVEVTVGQWAFTLLTEGRGLTAGTAGIVVAGYWAGLTIGRLVLGTIGHRLDPERLLDVVTGAALAGALLLWADPAGKGYLVLPVLGLAFAVMFPVMVNRTPVYLGAARSTRAVGYQMAAAAVGFSTLPYAVGVLADRHGIDVASPVAVVAILALGAVWTAIRVNARARRAAAAPAS